MAIYRVAGQMLQSTLERDGNSLAFVDTASTTAVLLVDIANSRVGVNSNTANVTLDVAGNIAAYNLSVTGNLTATINISGANLNATTVSATGNVIGGNISTVGLVTAVGNVIGGNIRTANTVSATGNVIGGNISTAGLVTATGNVIGGNISTAGLVTAVGNVIGGNINTANVVSAVGNVIGGNINTANVVSAVGNVIGGNIRTANIVSATGNVIGGNILTGGLISATGNLTAGNVNTTLVSATGNVKASNVVVGNILIPSSGNVTLGNVNINYLANPVANSDAATKFYVDTTNAAAFGNLTISNTTISTSLANGNITLLATGTGCVQVGGTGGFVVPVGNTAQRPAPVSTGTIRFNTTTTQLEVWDGSQWVAASGDISVITTQIIDGDGTTTTFALDQATTAESILVSINGILQVPAVNYNTTTSPNQIIFTTAPSIADVIQVRFIASTSVISGLNNGTSNISIATSSGNITLSAGGTSNVLVITSTGIIVNGTTSLVGNIASANVTGNVTAANLTGNIYTNSIINTGANGTGNIGSSSTYFNRIFATATTALYADLAELYSADAEYQPGTVVSFGGNQEITMSITDADPCVAGVVSTAPAHLMNSGIIAEFPTALALTGRVPCRVIGPVQAGDMMVSASGGYARAEKSPAMGTVIGKAIQNFDGESGTIEIVVGRL